MLTGTNGPLHQTKEHQVQISAEAAGKDIKHKRINYGQINPRKSQKLPCGVFMVRFFSHQIVCLYP